MPLRLPKVTPKITLNIWDIDDTLFETAARVNLIGPNGHIRSMAPGEYTKYVLEEGEKFDFSEFRSGKVFRESAKPINEVLDRAKEMVSRKNGKAESILLTARSDFDDHHEFLQAFRDHGFPIDDVYVERAGNISGRYDNRWGAHIAKAAIIRKYVASGKYDRIRMWDDSEKNLEMLLKLSKLHPEIEFIGYLVHGSPQVKVSRYQSEFSEDIKIPHSGMNISREHMPQIGTKVVKDFLSQLKDEGVHYKEIMVKAGDLKPSQGEFNLEKVADYINQRVIHDAHIIISNDGYVLDGHHRWLVQYNLNKNVKMKAWKIDMPIIELIAYAKRFSGVSYKKVTDKIRKVVHEAVTERNYAG